MTTNLELIKGTSREVYYITDVDSKLIIYSELSTVNKGVFDAYINALKAEFANKSLAFTVDNTEVIYNQSLDILATVEDGDLEDEVIYDNITFSALATDTQSKMTDFINMANSL